MLKHKFRVLKVRFYSLFSKINRSPIIILGNQKSGTSVITHLIADYGGLTKTVDIPESWWPTLEDLLGGALPLEDFARKYSLYFSREVIKEPNLTFLFDQLSHIHPAAKFIFVIRDPRSNIRSLLNRISVPGHLPQMDEDLARVIPPNWRAVFDASLWDLPDGNYVEVLAWRWVRAARVYLNNQDRIHLVRYEDFNADKLQTIEKLAQKLGIVQKREIKDRLDVQFQPKGNKSISWEAFFEENLDRIEDICGREMAELGYVK
ncbi:Sulfotransferase family protein [Fodinibius roseus]|uniref:Sulfotransferase family protein n=1 Tax=Fodinibius roseus TaxID=1194090 RepID=A0A1M5F0G0_9BACT|nr:Sulfotransferase family protein [Fodinibius roseus]